MTMPSNQRIEDYALISDCATAALVGRTEASLRAARSTLLARMRQRNSAIHGVSLPLLAGSSRFRRGSPGDKWPLGRASDSSARAVLASAS